MNFRKQEQRRPRGASRCRGIWQSLAMLLALAGLSAPVRAECGHPKVTMEGRTSDIEGGCRALAEVLGYFRSLNFEVEPQAHVVFKGLVTIPSHVAEGRQPAQAMQVSGFFDVSRKRVEVTTGDSHHRAGRKPWGLAWGDDIAYSILIHELAHMATHTAAAGRQKSLSRAWLEYIASAIQFDLMPQALRNDVLALNASVRTFDSPDQVNGYVHAMDPDAFAVSAYLHARSQGGRAFLQRLIAGTVPFDTGENVLWSK